MSAHGIQIKFVDNFSTCEAGGSLNAQLCFTGP